MLSMTLSQHQEPITTQLPKKLEAGTSTPSQEVYDRLKMVQRVLKRNGILPAYKYRFRQYAALNSSLLVQTGEMENGAGNIPIAIIGCSRMLQGLEDKKCEEDPHPLLQGLAEKVSSRVRVDYFFTDKREMVIKFDDAILVVGCPLER